MVSAVRFAMSFPVLVLAIPAGVLADRVDRRRLLLITQIMLLTTATTMTVLTAAEYISSWGLLAMTFVMGLGIVIHVPTWQASIPEIVPRDQLSRAIALGSVSFNLARSVGPAIAGVLIASLGAWSAFAVNAMSFAGVIAVLAFWKRHSTESTRGLSFRLSLVQGLRYMFRTVVTRHVMIGVVMFVLPASVLWSLLPLVVRDQLGWDARGFGLMVAAVGFGAVIAAAIMPRLIRHFGSDLAVFQAMVVYGVGLWALSQTHSRMIAIAAAIAMGIGWMITLTSFNTAAQVTLPRRLRARGMGCYLSAFAFSMSAGSILWGRLAGSTSVRFTLVVTAVVIVISAIVRLAFPINSASTSR
jgi:MFS family permease